MTTGDEVPGRVSIYLASCAAGHVHEIAIIKGDTLPPCGERILAGVGTSICLAPCEYEFLRYEDLPPKDQTGAD